MEAGLISVIVPVYNTEAYLPACIDSIRGQTYRNLDIILVDDGSKDGSGRICDEAAAADPRIKVIHAENGGPTKACVRGLEAAKGSFVTLIDSDDWIDPEMIGAMAAELSDAPEVRDAQVICCNHSIDRPDGSGQFMRNGAAPGVYEGEKLRTEIFDRIIGEENRTIFLSRCMKLLPTDLIKQNLHYTDYRIRVGDDLSIMLPTLLDAKRIVVLKDAYYYHYRNVPVSLTHSFNKHLDEDIRLLMPVMRNICCAKADRFTAGIEDRQEPIDAMISRERLFLCMLQIKNAFRSPEADVTGSVRKVLEDGNIAALTKQYPLALHDRGNRLLYSIMKKPTTLKILIAGMAFRWKNRA